jgi:phage recombination protein Bet
MELIMNNVAPLRPGPVQPVSWWTDSKMVALVKRTAAKDCNEDEFNQFVSVCRDLGLSPLRKQIYAFVFNKGDAERRNMALVVGIDGGRAIAARSGNYRPDDKPPEWVFSEEAKNPLTNPHGVVTCTVGVYHRPTRNDPFERITATVFWDEFAPIIRSGDADAYEWVGTGTYYPEGHKKAGQEKMARRLREGASANVTERLDPKKEQWIRGGRHKIALCAEMQALRRGWPEDMSRVYVEEETDRAGSVIDAEYSELTPSEMVVKAETEDRLGRIGGPALFATFDDAGTLERVPHGQFADRMLEATERLAPEAVAALVERNRPALQEFWAYNKGDALELKKTLEARSGGGSAAAPRQAEPADAAAPQHGESATGRSGPVNSAPVPGALSGQEAFKLRSSLIAEIHKLTTVNDFLTFARDSRVHLDRLPDKLRGEVDTEFQRCQSHIAGNA